MGIGPGQPDEAVQSGRQWVNISGSSIHPPLQRPLYPQAIKTTQKISFFLTRNTAREIRNLRSTEQVECIQTSKMKLQYWSKFLQHSIIKLKFSSRASQTVPCDIFFFCFWNLSPRPIKMLAIRCSRIRKPNVYIIVIG